MDFGDREVRVGSQKHFFTNLLFHNELFPGRMLVGRPAEFLEGFSIIEFDPNRKSRLRLLRSSQVVVKRCRRDSKIGMESRFG